MSLDITIISYGCRWGTHPVELTWTPLDVRKFGNPHHNPKLRNLRGTDKPVQDELLAYEAFVALLNEMTRKIVKSEQSKLIFGVYCTAGRHRSVAFAELLAENLRLHGISSTVLHRDKDKVRK